MSMFIASDKPIILVTGGNGQLGQEFRRIATFQEQYELLFTTRESLDITKLDKIQNVFAKWKPNYCINCAAYTAVDKAESEQEAAFQLNEDAIGHLISTCSEQGTKLINYSTDYVYDSIIDRPIQEDDPCTPRSIYGQSKRAGEKLLESSDIDWINFRVSWLYSSFKNNFVKTMLRLGAERDELNIVADQIGTPTYAQDLASDTIKIISQLEKEEVGLRNNYNYSNISTTNWADFARSIFDMASITCKVNDTTTEAYGAPAPRPLWSAMDKSRLLNTFDIELKMWQESLEECLQELEY